MTISSVKIGVDVNDNGSTKKVIKDVNVLHKSLEGAANVANKINVGGGASAKKAAYMPSASSARAAYMEENTSYGVARSAVGTGAAGRDFAQQAQGLGGVVRLYATYAANLFAVSAAYQALSAAQDTANMVKGLDQLGAASGIALGSLSKDLVKATDGAVSLREAMEATVKASSSGMSSKDILRMGEVAKKAAQALGVDMSDALSRISRGITKLEPELLDELGIFTRIDPAVQAYAKSVDKSVSSLTQFERQMAFSNAVLAEGEAKFSEINIQTNAYTKMLAILKDTATAVGDALNTVLVPIINILSSNPTALFVMLAGMAAMVVKQAIPAFADLTKSMQENQQQLVEASADRVALMKAEQSKMKILAAETAKNTFRVYIKEADDAAEAAVESLEKAQAKLKGIQGGTRVPSQASAVQSVLGTEDLTQLTSKQVSDLENYANKLTQLNKKNAVEVQNLATATREVYNTHVLYGKAQEAQVAAATKASAEEETKLKSTLHYRAANMELQRESLTLLKNQTIAAAGENVRIKGIAGAWREVNSSIKEYNAQREKGSGFEVAGDKQIGRTRAGLIKLGAGFSILTGLVSGAVSAIGPWAEAIAVGAIALGFLDAWLDKAAESVSNFNDSVNSSIEATKNLSSVVEKYSDTKIDETFSVKAIEAYSSSLINVADSFDSIGRNAEKARKEIEKSTWSTAKNNFKEFFGFGVSGGEKDAIKAAVDSLLISVKKAPSALNSMNKALTDTFGVKSTSNAKELEETIEKLYADPTKREQLVRIIRNTGIELGIAASAQKEFRSALDTAVESSKALGESFKFSSPLSKLAVDGINALNSLAKSGKTTEDQFTSLNELFEKSKNLDLFGDSVFSAQQLGAELDKIRTKYTDNQEAIKRGEEEITKLTKKEDALIAQFGDSPTYSKQATEALEAATKARLAAESQVRGLIKQSKDSASSINALFQKTLEASSKGISGYYNILEKQITVALSAPLSAFKNSVTASLGNVKGVADREASTAQADLGYQKMQIDLEVDGLMYLRRIAVATELTQAQQAANPGRIALDAARASGDPVLVTEVQKRYAEVFAKEAAVLRKKEALSRGSTDPRLMLANARETNDQEMIGTAMALVGASQKRASLGDQSRAVEYTRGLKTVGEGFIDSTKAVAEAQKANVLQQEKLELSKQQQGFLTREQLLTLQTTNLEKIGIDAVASMLPLLKEHAEVTYKINSGKLNGLEIQEQENLQVAATTNLLRIRDQTEIKSTAEKLKTAKDLDELTQKEIAQKYTLLEIAEETKAASTVLGISIVSEGIGAQKDIGIDTSAQDLVLQKMQQEEAFNSARNAAALSQNRLLEERASTITKLGELEQVNYQKETDALIAKYATISAGEAATKATEDARLIVQQQILDVTREQELATLRIQSASEALAGIFGSVGEAAGNLLETFTSISQRRENDVNKEAALEEIIWSSTASKKEQTAAEEDLSNLKSKSAIQEQKDSLSIISSSKKMFKEKTVAHKALAATEKALQVKSLALEAQKLAKQISMWWTGVSVKVAAAVAGEAGTTAATGAGFLSRLPIYIKEIYASWGKMGPWMVGAAAVFIASMLGGGGSKSASFVPSAEQRQETQGTAMSWDAQGNKVQTSRGVFGDEDAKSESIANSLEIIKDNSIDGLAYDNKMLRSLEGLRNALDATAKGLYGIRGLRAGSLSGIAEGTNTSGGLLGIGGLFSKSTTKKIVDSGIQLKGTFYDLISGVKGTINTFETVRTTVKKSGFLGIGGSTKTKVSTKFKDLEGLDEKAFDSLVNAFGYAADTLYSVAETAGVSSTTVEDALKSIRVDEMASLRGLTGEDFTKELSNVIGKVLDDASYAIFTSFEQYANFGEGMLETVIRVVDSNKKVNQALSNMGVVSKTLEYSITETLINAANGLDTFLDKAEFFRQNFLSEAEQLAPIQSAVTTELARIAKLGFTSADGLVDTRKEFKALIHSLDLTTETGREAYISLINVAEGFHTVTEVMEESLQKTIDKFKNFAQSLREFRDNLVLGSASILTPLQKYAESKLQFEETYTKALAGDEQAQSKLTGSAQAFLEASKGYFASSSAYTQDFNSVLEKIGYGITSAEASVSVAELQLGVANTQVDLLTSINTNIAILAGVPQMAKGGLGRGLTLVGEVGPELVDFNQPGRVYTADQTAGMFAPRANVSNNMFAVVAELRQVKQEIAQLRKEQQQQTGDLIVSNYDANQRNAKEVAQAVEEVTTATQWASRNEVTIV